MQKIKSTHFHRQCKWWGCRQRAAEDGEGDEKGVEAFDFTAHFQECNEDQVSYSNGKAPPAPNAPCWDGECPNQGFNTEETRDEYPSTAEKTEAEGKMTCLRGLLKNFKWQFIKRVKKSKQHFKVSKCLVHIVQQMLIPRWWIPVNCKIL